MNQNIEPEADWDSGSCQRNAVAPAQLFIFVTSSLSVFNAPSSSSHPELI